MYACECTSICCVHVCKCIYVYMFVFGCVVQRYGTVWWDQDPLREIQIYTLYGSDTLAIRRPTHEMIQRFVSVRTVKTKWWLSSKTVSFHVSVYSCIIFLFIVVSSIYLLLVSFHVTIYFILLVWLPVSLHEASMSVHFDYIAYLSVY